MMARLMYLHLMNSAVGVCLRGFSIRHSRRSRHLTDSDCISTKIVRVAKERIRFDCGHLEDVVA